MGLKARQRENIKRRNEGQEPEPGCGRGTSVKRWARYLSRVTHRKIIVINPEKYLNSSRTK